MSGDRRHFEVLGSSELPDGFSVRRQGLDRVFGYPEPRPINSLSCKYEFIRVLKDSVFSQKSHVVGCRVEQVLDTVFMEDAVVNIPVHFLDIPSDFVETVSVGVT